MIHLARVRWMLPMTALLALWACPTPVPAPPKPPATLGIDPAQPGARDSVLALGRRQYYDQNIGAAARTLLERDIDVTLEPMDSTWLADSAMLDQGLVVARFINHGIDTLPRLGLAPSATTYWLIYRRDGQLLSDFIADADGSGFDRTGVPTDLHVPSRGWRQSLAQWQIAAPVSAIGAGATARLRLAAGVPAQPWIACIQFGCCKPPQ